jgi:hypothetical protein
MLSIEKSSIPVNSMLDKYSSITGAYVDAYSTEIATQVAFSEIIFAFYTTPLFKLERLILTFIFLPSTDDQARRLADGTVDKFAAWTVESRGENEILMCDVVQRTRSWLMVKHEGAGTRLYFGSAVVPKRGKTSLEFGYRGLLGFHQINPHVLQ